MTQVRIFNPEPNRGLSEANFRKICKNGFGDGNNAYAHSMAWFNGHLYVGTTRANLCLIRSSMPHVKIDMWPVECPHKVYTPEFERNWARAEIWRYNPVIKHWERVFQAPMTLAKEGDEFSRDLGYRGMAVFQGKSDPEPALYVSTWSRSRANGPLIMRTEDGKNFEVVSKPGLVGLPVTSLRLLIPFKGRLFTAPTSATGGNANTSGVAQVYESSDPAKGEWRAASDRGFGDPENRTIFELRGFGDYLYAGTVNNNGFQIWRTKAEGEPPYHWTNVITNGAGRGSLNQIAASMMVFKDALYIGTGIQNGGYDHLNKIGPAGAEIIRIHHDGSWDLLMGDIRDGRYPLSGLSAGFNNLCNGYVWRMGVHDGWLYAGTMEWSDIMCYISLEGRPDKTVRMLQQVGLEEIVKYQGGFEVWRTFDGENWLPVTRQGFGNVYNYGVRNFISTSYGLFIGTANPFGPRVAVRQEGKWTYVDNPNGGLEILQGALDWDSQLQTQEKPPL
ncbi:hypothetical protein CEN45_06355 [Fischerella thermalis CCMEE 5198]|jgi:hypothetical protein|uniref:hypothetical protein n=1 Tax=Fischerella thermalis TaxID=372787 RepID=UPI000C80D23A|nr:hypothetical protein [Fischerella thermalis]PMB02034.1 hypothetical protein CI594_08270 [Fischerella thermalis CCMEE 5196]PMB25280.1 hypothetical protein CEN45_06355 [Fischerella thermalis CCMEE 5198]PMB53185.1 hypothetical protein CEN39_05860 [Fischerella thermalis CCMEE 5201]